MVNSGCSQAHSNTMELALLLEKLTNEKLLHLHAVASKNNDVQLADFVEREFLGEQNGEFLSDADSHPKVAAKPYEKPVMVETNLSGVHPSRG
ncbi:hypothetical protein L1987_85822 [Smallanthus sonchifolius]|uniref:Uncharacterized protein n=1 Tax=Smallanthus sonchifolius TaxID=185202 RepID=A0ACB8XYN1_9ASTR|nr:hypothetical protein L1987_85822 [Smallanthus sonchifolius]